MPRATAPLRALTSFLIALAIAFAALFAIGPPPAGAEGPVRVVAVGDIACGSGSGGARCQDAATAALAASMAPRAVFGLGDLQYETGSLSDFRNYYAKTWGRFDPITLPVPGNHEYDTAGASGYFDYFNGVGAATGRAGVRGKGWYSQDVGTWHVVALNSNCGAVGCHAGSEQERWLRADLAANRRTCTAAIWHHPRWTSGTHGEATNVQALVDALDEAQVDLLLVGHEHLYERMSPQTAAGTRTSSGLRQFTVGTGGKSLHGLGTRHPNSERVVTGHDGVLQLDLADGGYSWIFRTTDGADRDAGSATCRRAAAQPSGDAETSDGYGLVARDGGIFTYGDQPFHGSTGDLRLNAPIVGAATTPSGRGYWLVASDGGVFTFGDATFHGSTGTMRLRSPIVGIAPTGSGRGYWLVAADGGIFTFGDAAFLGSTGDLRLRAPIVAMAPTPSGDGYRLVASHGGIFTFGDASFHGSTGGSPLNAPIVGIATTPTGGGYWLVATDGGVFTFGDAAFLGSTGAMRLNSPVVDVASTATGRGYRFVAADGGVFVFGDAEFLGSAGGGPLNQPVVGLLD